MGNKMQTNYYEILPPFSKLMIIPDHFTHLVRVQFFIPANLAGLEHQNYDDYVGEVALDEHYIPSFVERFQEEIPLISTFWSNRGTACKFHKKIKDLPEDTNLIVQDSQGVRIITLKQLLENTKSMVKYQHIY